MALDEEDDTSDILKEAKSLYKLAKDAWSEIYDNAESDLYFLSDVPGAQWDTGAFNDRVSKGRPCLTLDQLDKFCNQVVNDERMSTPSINVIPDGNDAAIEDAEIFEGIIRNIEYQSEADTAYDTAAESAVKCSIGFIKVETAYEDEDGFNQVLRVVRVPNSLSILIDPDSIKIDGSDATYGFELISQSVKDFKKEHPDSAPVSFSEEPDVKALTDNEQITLAVFYKIDEETKTIGVRLDAQSMQPVIEEVDSEQEYLQTRKQTKKVVRQYKLSGQDILEKTIFPGRYVPLIPCYGKEMWRDGKRYLHSLIRKAKPAQQLFNMWKSLETELLMRQPRSNFAAPNLAIQNFADDWKSPEDAAVLRYDHVDEDGLPIPAPTPLNPPQFPQGIEIAAQSALQAIKDATGLYDASLGQRSNEVSGIAIQSRQKEGDVATFHFTDNRVKSITQVGRVLVFAIPEVYDTPRVVNMIDQEENPKPVGINGAMVEGQEKPIDLKAGKFTVKVKTGASYTTKREESAQFMQQVIQADPQLMQVFGDLMFENMDIAGAQAIANRLKKIMPPNLVDDDNQDPQVAALQQQLQQAQQAMQAMQAQLQAAQNDQQLKQTELMLKAKELDTKTQLGTADIALKQQDMQANAQDKQYDVLMKQKELEIKQLELEIKKIDATAAIQSAQAQHQTELLRLANSAAPEGPNPQERGSYNV